MILYNVDDYKMPKLYIQLSVDNADVRMSRNQVNNFTFSCQVDNADVTQSGKQLYIQLSVNNTDIRMSHSQVNRAQELYKENTYCPFSLGL